MLRIFFSSTRQMVWLPVLTGTILGLASSAMGQARPQVLTPVDPAAMITLKGNTLPVASPLNDRGRVADAMPTGRLMLQLHPSADQQAALDKLVAAQQDPKSPSFHKWLTTDQYARQFGASDADIQAVTAYLSQQGFTVNRVLPHKLAIEFWGTAGQVKSAFKTEIHSYSVNGQRFFANDRDPQIPSALSPVVAGIVSMSNYHPAPKAAGVTQASVAQLTGKIQQGGRSGGVHAMYTDPAFGATGAVNVAPGDIAAIYDIPGTATGAGVTIGLVGNSNVNLTYVQNYRTTFGLGTRTPAVIIDGDDPGVNGDYSVDTAQLELLSAVAPAASLNYYTSASTDLGTGLNFALIRAVTDDSVQVLLLSQESCEANLGTTVNYFLNTASEFASALGMSIVAPSGNGGSASCDSQLGYGNTFHPAATKGLSVNGYATSPFVTAVGATDFYYPPAERTQAGVLACCWNVNNGGAGGYTSAKGYIEEQPWNDSNLVNDGIASVGFLASGGGVSTLGGVSADLTTSMPYPEPAWQTPVVPASLSTGNSGSARVIPDVSIFGGDGNNGSSYMICVQANECVNGAPGTNGNPGTLVYEPAGGTETSAATFAGIAALVVQAHGAQGNINPTLYSMYTTVPSAFHDVVNGTNTVMCVTGSPDCGADGFMASNGAQAYSATTGYDAASGLGSVDVANLINKWTPPNTTATTTSFTLTMVGTSTPITTFVHGTTVQANINVNSGAGTPTGDVALIAAAAAPANTGVNHFTLTNGSVIATDSISGLPGGTYNLSVRYAGDETFAPSVSAPVNVTITPETSTIYLESTSFTPGASLSYGTPVTVLLYVFSATNPNSIGTPTGYVTVTDAGTQISVIPVDSQGYATYKAILPAGAHALGFTYGGDVSYQSSSYKATLSVSVNGQPTTTTLSTSNTNDGKGDYVQLVAQVNTSSSNSGTVTWPTGTITFKTVGTNGKTLGTSVLVPGTSSGGQVAGIANYQLPGSKLTTNPALVVASFAPSSSNYAGSLSNILSLTTTSAAGLNTSTTKVATSDGKASYFDYDDSITLNVTVTGGGVQPTGTVTLYDNGVLLGTATLTGTMASYTINQNAAGVLPLTLGRNAITVQYNGDATHATSTREIGLTILDEGSLPDFSLQSYTVFGTISPTVATTAFTLQLTSINNFAALGQKVTFTAAAPAGIACTLGSATVTFAANATYATNTVTCGAAAGYTIASAEPGQRPLNGFWIASGGAALASVFLLSIPARRKSWRKLVGSLVVILAIGLATGATAGLMGCGGNAASASALAKSSAASDASAVSESKAAVTPLAGKTLAAGTYQVLIKATAPFATNVQSNTATLQTHSVPLQVVVQ